MFYDRPDCTTLSFFPDDYGTQSGVFVFKNFFSDEECKTVEDFLDNAEDGQHPDTLINWYAKRSTKPIPGVINIWEKVSDIIYPEFVIHPAVNALAIKAPDDEGMFAHSDSPGKNMCGLLTQVDIWKTCCELDFGLIAYFGNFEGGEVYYPKINPDGSRKSDGDSEEMLTYKPERGDVVIHGAFDPHTHGVRPVTSGRRYAYTNFVLKPEVNPGTFYNYKTPEYYNQIGDKSMARIREWGTPLKENPQFSPERIKMMQESGLEGQALAEAFPFDHEE